MGEERLCFRPLYFRFNSFFRKLYTTTTSSNSLTLFFLSIPSSLPTVFGLSLMRGNFAHRDGEYEKNSLSKNRYYLIPTLPKVERCSDGPVVAAPLPVAPNGPTGNPPGRIPTPAGTVGIERMAALFDKPVLTL